MASSSLPPCSSTMLGDAEQVGNVCKGHSCLCATGRREVAQHRPAPPRNGDKESSIGHRTLLGGLLSLRLSPRRFRSDQPSCPSPSWATPETAQPAALPTARRGQPLRALQALGPAVPLKLTPSNCLRMLSTDRFCESRMRVILTSGSTRGEDGVLLLHRLLSYSTNVLSISVQPMGRGRIISV